jgi:hypothetical protein
MGPMRVAVEHSRWGLFLGVGRERMWWSNLPVTASISTAVTFDTQQHAEGFFTCHIINELDELTYHHINSDELHASIKELVEAGLGRHTPVLLSCLRPEGNA